MASLYNWIVFLHVAGAFTFVLAHGVSAGVALKLRQEREVPRVQALLDLSNVATQGTYVGLVILLIGGITAAFMAGLWGRGWIWTAIALLVLMIAFMYARASRYYGEVRARLASPTTFPGKAPALRPLRTRGSSRDFLRRRARWSSPPGARSD